MAANFGLVRYNDRYREAVLNLHAEAMQELPPGLELPENEHFDLLNIETCYLQAGGEFLVGLLDDEPVAMGGYKRVDANIAELKRFRVKKALRGQGLGSVLLKEVERIAAENGITRIVLETVKFRPLTLKYYLKHGYVHCGDQHYGTVETVCFEKHLERV
jgi:GNAT superfamily N-acetyltransferase